MRLALNFGPGILGVLLEALGIFWVLTFGSIQSSLSLEIASICHGHQIRPCILQPEHLPSYLHLDRGWKMHLLLSFSEHPDRRLLTSPAVGWS